MTIVICSECQREIVRIKGGPDEERLKLCEACKRKLARMEAA
jgi:hypothetical protein